MAPGIVPKSERKPLDPKYKPSPPKSSEKNGANREAGRPFEQYDDDRDELVNDFLGGTDEEFRPLSSEFNLPDDKEGSSQTVDEVSVSSATTTKKSKKKSSRTTTTTTTTTPAPTSSSEEESSEETQQPSAATNNNGRLSGLVVNRDRGEVRLQLKLYSFK